MNGGVLPTAPVIMLLAVLAFPLGSCSSDRQQYTGPGMTTIVFKHGKLAGDPAPFRKLLDRFERGNPGIRVRDEPLPASTDEQHQFYVINLEGMSADATTGARLENQGGRTMPAKEGERR